MPTILTRSKRLKLREKRRSHWGLLNVNTAARTSGKHSRLIAQIRAGFKPLPAVSNEPPNQTPDDFSI